MCVSLRDATTMTRTTWWTSFARTRRKLPAKVTRSNRRPRIKLTRNELDKNASIRVLARRLKRRVDAAVSRRKTRRQLLLQSLLCIFLTLDTQNARITRAVIVFGQFGSNTPTNHILMECHLFYFRLVFLGIRCSSQGRDCGDCKMTLGYLRASLMEEFVVYRLGWAKWRDATSRWNVTFSILR